VIQLDRPELITRTSPESRIGLRCPLSLLLVVIEALELAVEIPYERHLVS
jgi:hypothetical protein